ncbi:MAG TPA: Arm DNA-binding domain-containing protein [Mesorhizobium sp.]
MVKIGDAPVTPQREFVMDKPHNQKLGKKTVNEAEIRPARYTIFDADVRGFGLRVFPSGQKSWVLEYKNIEGGRKASTRRITIGKVSEFTPEEARKLADRLRSQVKVGIDPQHEKAERRKAATVTELANSFLETHVSKKRKAGTHALYKDILDRLVLPELGARKAANVRRSDYSIPGKSSGCGSGVNVFFRRQARPHPGGLQPCTGD